MSPLKVFVAQFASLIIWVLIAAAVVSGLLGEWLDTGAILAIVVLNAVLGFVQEYRAEKSLAALRKLTSPTSRVVRDGERSIVAARELVPGDLVEIESGDHVPADGRVVWVANFATQEASLTGESLPVEKVAEPLGTADTSLGDRRNMLFSGTAAVSGRARMLVTGTGADTELGKIARLLQGVESEPTPLQRQLAALGRLLIYICLGIVLIVFVVEIARGGKVMDMFLVAVSLAVAAIPEGLPAVVTVALALGVQRMVKRRALIRKLPAVETLGCTSVICTDKTGTLTQNQMMVRHVWAGNAMFDLQGNGYEPHGRVLAGSREIAPDALPPALRLALQTGLLCNAATLSRKETRWEVVGDPTEGALLCAAARGGLGRQTLEAAEPLTAEIPFDSDRKLMTVLRKTAAGWTAYVKGAPDIVLARAGSILAADGTEQALSAAGRQQVGEVNSGLAGKGLRVLGMAVRRFTVLPDHLDAASVEKELLFVGLQAMQDPPRPEVAAAVQTCLRAGIRPVMITGDHPQTAEAIGREIGMLGPETQVMNGAELERLSDAELTRRVRHTGAYARVSAEHKLRIVRAWRANGAIVAMTGDGVNDAPALKEADIGIAMGITGTDVSKEAADMVVLDDNFASIVAAIEEGRAIYANIRKFVFYLLSCNMGEVLVMFVAALVGWPLPLVPIQILWVNLVTDGFPALALGVDPPEKDLMQRPVRRKNERMIGRAFLADMLTSGLVIGGASLAAFGFTYYFVYAAADETVRLTAARTVTFLTLVGSQLVHAFNCRSDRRSLFALGVFSNPTLVAMVLLSLALQLVTILWAPAQRIFKTSMPGWNDLLLIAALSLLPLLVFELLKLRRHPRVAASH